MMKQVCQQPIFLIVCMGFALMTFSSCKEINVFQWAAGGQNENCSSDAVCFVDAMQAIKTKDHVKAKAVGERIVDAQTQNYVLTLAASIKAGDLLAVMEKFAAKDDFTVKDLGDVCPPGTLADDEIDTLMAADDKPQYKTMGRLCLSSEAKEDVSDAQKLLDDLRTSVAAGGSVDNSKTGESLDNAAAKDMCKEFKGDESCTGLTAEEVQDYLKKNF